LEKVPNPWPFIEDCYERVPVCHSINVKARSDLYSFPATIGRDMPSSDRLSKSPLVEEYCRYWQANGSTDRLERFLKQFPRLSPGQLVEVLLADEILEWQSGSGPSVERYLQRFPIVAEQRQLVLELVCGEIRLARALGLSVNVDEYVGRFPDLADPLQRQMELTAWLEKEQPTAEPTDGWSRRGIG
jgi:hypothetical protein